VKKEALVLIDIQNNYFEEGEYKLFHPEEASLKAKKVLENFRANGKPVIHIKHNFYINELSVAETRDDVPSTKTSLL
jgi:nicotinamidase-related amidase